MRTEIFPGKFSVLNQIGDFYATAASEAGLDDQASYDVQLAVDEAVANIIEHAYGGEGIGDVECSYEIHPEKLIILIRDKGKSFSMRNVEAPDLDSDPCKRKPRGLGLHFMRSLMDTLEFSFNGGSNLLTMEKFRVNATAPS